MVIRAEKIYDSFTTQYTFDVIYKPCTGISWLTCYFGEEVLANSMLVLVHALQEFFWYDLYKYYHALGIISRIIIMIAHRWVPDSRPRTLCESETAWKGAVWLDHILRNSTCHRETSPLLTSVMHSRQLQKPAWWGNPRENPTCWLIMPSEILQKYLWYHVISLPLLNTTLNNTKHNDYCCCYEIEQLFLSVGSLWIPAMSNWLTTALAMYDTLPYVPPGGRL